MRVVAADGSTDGKLRHLPGEEVWLVGEWRDSGERKFYFCNHPPTAALRDLARAIKARWACEHAHQQLKDELGLDHFEGRSWPGLHRHALLAMLAFTFLQHRRLRDPPARRGRGENAPDAAGGSTGDHRRARAPATLPTVPGAVAPAAWT